MKTQPGKDAPLPTAAGKAVSAAFKVVYAKFKLHFYKSIVDRFEHREASLTTIETFCAETIQALGQPTVNELAAFLNISPPNAVYKVNNLVAKGYVKKRRSGDDKREVHLQVTQKYIEYYSISNGYVERVMDRIAARFPPEDVDTFRRILTTIYSELMPEVPLPQDRRPTDSVAPAADSTASLEEGEQEVDAEALAASGLSFATPSDTSFSFAATREEL